MLRPITQLAMTLPILAAPQMASALERTEPENRVWGKNAETQAGVRAKRGLNADTRWENRKPRWGIVSDYPDVPSGIPGNPTGAGDWDLGAGNYLMAFGETQNAMGVELLGAAYGFTGGMFGPMMNLPFIMEGLGASPETMAGFERGDLYGAVGGGVAGLPLLGRSLLGAGCFVEGTEVVTEDGLVAIEKVKAGDWVWTHDPVGGTTELRQVLAVSTRTAHSLVHLDIGESVVTTTDEHPFWVDGRGWTKAGELARGDVLWRLDGSTIELDDIELEPARTTVYNLEVEGFATYFVSEPEILVHNSRLLGLNALDDVGRAVQTQLSSSRVLPGLGQGIFNAGSAFTPWRAATRSGGELLETVSSPRVAARLTQGQQSAVRKIGNIIKNHLKPGPKGDISGTVSDMVGNPIPKPGGGYWNHVQEMQNTLRGLRRHARTLNGVADPAAQAARQQALDSIRMIEDAIRGAGL